MKSTATLVYSDEETEVYEVRNPQGKVIGSNVTDLTAEEITEPVES